MEDTFNTLNSIGKAISGFGFTVSEYVSSSTIDLKGLESMSNGKLIELADIVRDLFKGNELLEPPSICTIGGQSAGKSMALNSICGIDILPNGKSIVTRTPIHIRMVHLNSIDHIKVEFFEYSNDCTAFTTLKTFKVDLNCPQDQLYPITQEIENITSKYAGKSKNVVDRPINIKIMSPKVPNLSIIDLPGLTHIALTDKGQPSNIKQNIENMLTKYISSPRTIIMAIIPSTSDVEADMGLGLIKQFDPNFDRTIGVLTKIDLLVDSNIERYLLNAVSKDLQVKYGYFAVRNRSSEEVKTHTVSEGYELEKAYFNAHPTYSKSDAKDRMGSIKLASRLSEILISHLKACLPSVIDEIRKLDKNIESNLDEIGRDYPQSIEEKRYILNMLVSDFQKIYDLSITGRGAEYNTGAHIKRNILDLKIQCSSINPFDPNIYTDSKIKDIIDDYDGIHMTSSAISTGIIEALFQSTDEPHPFSNSQNTDIDIRRCDPLTVLIDPYKKCLKSIQKNLSDLATNILNKERFSRFPKLCTRIQDIVSNSIVPLRYQEVIADIEKRIVAEKRCIWTDDINFSMISLYEVEGGKKDKSKSTGVIDPNIIRKVLYDYFSIIRSDLMTYIHKQIVAYFVKEVVIDINTCLNHKILEKSTLDVLLEENKDKATKRAELYSTKQKIELVKSMIKEIE